MGLLWTYILWKNGFIDPTLRRIKNSDEFELIWECSRHNIFNDKLRTLPSLEDYHLKKLKSNISRKPM